MNNNSQDGYGLGNEGMFGFMPPQLTDDQLSKMSADEQLAYKLQREEYEGAAYYQNQSPAAASENTGLSSDYDYQPSEAPSSSRALRSSEPRPARVNMSGHGGPNNIANNDALRQLLANRYNPRMQRDARSESPPRFQRDARAPSPPPDEQQYNDQSSENNNYAEPEVRPPDMQSQPYSLIANDDQPASVPVMPVGRLSDREAAAYGIAGHRHHDRMQRAFQRASIDQINEEAERQKRTTMYCYAIGISMMILTPYMHCKGAHEHVFNHKEWLLVYVVICLGNFLRDSMNKRLDKMFNEGHISYRQRKYSKIGIWLTCEFVNLVWQIYGNFIYWTKESSQVEVCLKTENYTFMLTMYLMLIIGYIYAVFYVMFLCLFIFIYWRRMNNSRARRSETSRIIQRISRVKFSEDLFGAISEENECIICMTPFAPDDMITKLDCPGNHFYHTSCIENWIQQGSTQCPMCRHDISGQNIASNSGNQSELEAANLNNPVEAQA